MKPGFAVLLCRNGLPYSRACLKTLQNQTVPLEILIIDNAGSDGTAPWSRSEQQKDARVHRMSCDAVQSVSALWNAGLRWAWHHGAEEALVSNNDVELDPETYHALRVWGQEHEGLGVVTGVSAGEEQARGIGGDIMSSPHPDFSCFMLWKWAWDRIGGFDEEFAGGYVEDADYHIRLHRAGIGAVSVNVPYLHKRSATLRHADRAEAERIASNALANRRRLFDKYGVWPGTRGYERLFEP